MASWTANELTKIGNAEELQIAGRRRDGTLRDPVTIWVVRHGDDLYVRSYRGAESAWYRGAQAHHEGHIRAGGVAKDVTFADVTDAAVNTAIDAEYRDKYRRYGAPYIDPMVTSPARATTIKLVPR